MRSFKLLLISILLSTTAYGQGVVTTIAGIGTTGYNGDGIDATTAQLHEQTGKALVDDEGNVYLADVNRIRKIDKATGIITTICGDGTGNFSGDGGPAVDAQIYNVRCMAINSAGDLFLADYSNKRIRKIEKATGIITTIAGTGNQGFSGDGGPAIDADMKDPFFITLDNDENILISDNYRIRKVDANGIISTIAGTGANGNTGDGGLATAAAMHPAAMCVDTADNIFFLNADDVNLVYRLRKIDAVTSIVDNYAGTNISGFSGDGGPSTLAQIGICSDVAADKMGNIYVADHIYNYRIRKIDATGIITTVAGNGDHIFNGDFADPLSTAIDPGSVSLDSCGNLYITDLMAPRIRKVTYTECYTTLGTERALVKPAVSLYPNPATSMITITNSERINSVSITDVAGRVVLQKSGQSTQVNLDLKGLIPGVYFVWVDDNVVKFIHE